MTTPSRPATAAAGISVREEIARRNAAMSKSEGAEKDSPGPIRSKTSIRAPPPTTTAAATPHDTSRWRKPTLKIQPSAPSSHTAAPPRSANSPLYGAQMSPRAAFVPGSSVAAVQKTGSLSAGIFNADPEAARKMLQTALRYQREFEDATAVKANVETIAPPMWTQLKAAIMMLDAEHRIERKRRMEQDEKWRRLRDAQTFSPTSQTPPTPSTSTAPSSTPPPQQLPAEDQIRKIKQDRPKVDLLYLERWRGVLNDVRANFELKIAFVARARAQLGRDMVGAGDACWEQLETSLGTTTALFERAPPTSSRSPSSIPPPSSEGSSPISSQTSTPLSSSPPALRHLGPDTRHALAASPTRHDPPILWLPADTAEASSSQSDGARVQDPPESAAADVALESVESSVEELAMSARSAKGLDLCISEDMSSGMAGAFPNEHHISVHVPSLRLTSPPVYIDVDVLIADGEEGDESSSLLLPPVDDALNADGDDGDDSSLLSPPVDRVATLSVKSVAGADLAILPTAGLEADAEVRTGLESANDAESAGVLAIPPVEADEEPVAASLPPENTDPTPPAATTSPNPSPY
ncbi:hypothetical protein BDK51DRAFT_46240, partial [Blyttiomyces helicus]